MNSKETLIIICNDPRSQYYREIMRVSIDKWATKGSNHWGYWREATIFEQDLYHLGVRELELPF